MTIKKTIKKLSIILGLFLTAVGSITFDNNFLIVGIIISLIGEALFLLK